MNISRITAVKAALVLLYITLLIMPGWVFFAQRGGLDFLSTLPGFDAGLKLLFPLFGLYAFTLVAVQAMIGPNVDALSRYFIDIRNWHRYQGSFALLFIIIHPLSILLGFGWADYWSRNFISPQLSWWLLPAYIALTIVLTTVATAFIHWRFGKLRWWRSLHRLNYLVFGLAWLHSWFVGSDVRTTGLKYLWMFFAIVVSLSFIAKYGRTIFKPKPAARN